MAHSLLGEHVRIVQETFVQVFLCKPHATWNEVGLYLCLKEECAWCDVIWCGVVRRGDIIWLPLRRSRVTPAVCPRLFEILTTLTFRALGKTSHCVKPVDPIDKKKKTETGKARCPQAISNVSWIVKNTNEVGRQVRQCWRRCVGCCGEKTTSHVYDGYKNDICYRTQMTPQFFLHYRFN